MSAPAIGKQGFPSRFKVHVDQSGEQDWNELVSGFDDASVYQTWAYGSIHWGRHQLSHLVLRQDATCVAAAQVRIVRLPLLNRGVAYVRWGPLWRSRGTPTDPSLFHAILEALKNEYAVRRKLLLRVIPNIYDFSPDATAAQSSLAALGFQPNTRDRSYHTMHIDLQRPVEDLRKGLRQRWRNKLKHAEAAGFTVTVGTQIEFYQKFLGAYAEMMERKQFPTTVDVGEFGRIQQALPGSLKMRVLLCEKDGVLFNALVVAPVGDTGIYLLAATSNEGLKADGAFLLQWRALNLLKEDGRCWYDLGGANAGVNPGVYQFKSGLGGNPSCQLGLYECSVDGLSRLCVSGAESARAWLQRLKRPTRRHADSDAPPAAGADPSRPDGNSQSP